MAGVFVGIVGYALQNWLLKKRERERDEFVIKREKYEQWIKTLVAPLHTQGEERELAIKKCSKEFREVNNLILLYGSDEVVRALHVFWKAALNPQEKIVDSFKNIVLTMRKDLIKTGLNITDIEFLNY